MNNPMLPRRVAATVVGMLLALCAAQATAQNGAQPIIYPAKGQSAKQQDKDRYECHGWARERSGAYDPTQPVPALVATPTPPPPSNSASQSSPAAGMAAGAIGGAAVAELTNHNAGHGAAAGALGAAVIQRVKANQAQKKQQAQQQGAQQHAVQQQAVVNRQQRATYERALGACMEGRGYTVK